MSRAILSSSLVQGGSPPAESQAGFERGAIEGMLMPFRLGEPETVAEAGRIAARASEAISDIHGPADSKGQIVRVLLKRAFESGRCQCASGDGEKEGGHV